MPFKVGVRAALVIGVRIELWRGLRSVNGPSNSTSGWSRRRGGSTLRLAVPAGVAPAAGSARAALDSGLARPGRWYAEPGGGHQAGTCLSVNQPRLGWARLTELKCQPDVAIGDASGREVVASKMVRGLGGRTGHERVNLTG